MNSQRKHEYDPLSTELHDSNESCWALMFDHDDRKETRIFYLSLFEVYCCTIKGYQVVSFDHRYNVYKLMIFNHKSYEKYVCSVGSIKRIQEAAKR